MSYGGHLNRSESYHGRTWLYVFRDGSNILYVGMTCQPRQRIDSHKKQPWYLEATNVSWCEVETREEAKAREKELIQMTSPKYNRTNKETL